MIKAIYIDDDPALLELIKEYLEVDNDNIIETSTSAQAVLAMLSHDHFDAIISDYDMPGMNGLEFLKRVRSSGNQTPFILFTGKGREEVVTEALNLGANFYLQKGTDTRVMCLELNNTLNQLVQLARAERSSRINEQNYQDLLENSNSLIITTDMNADITFMNRYARRFFGFEHELVGHNMIGTIVPQSEHAMIDLMRMRHGWLNDPDRFNSVVVKNCKYNGEPVWIAWSSKAMRNGNDRIVGMKSVGSDITAQMQHEEELEHAKRMIRMTVDSMPVPMMVVGWKGEIMSCNKHFMRLWGIDGPVRSGDESIELLPRIYAALNSPEAFECDVLNATSSENPDRVVKLSLKDGRKVSFIPVPPQDLSPVAMVWCVGPEKGGNMARSDYLTFSGNDVADNSPDLLLQIDGEGTMTYASRSHLEALGRDPSDLIGRPVESLLSPGEGQKLFDILNEAGMERRSMSIELHMKRYDGTYGLFDVHLRSFVDSKSTIAGAVLSSREMPGASESEAVPESQAVLASMLRDIYNLDF